jgi:hypothetical protein
MPSLLAVAAVAALSACSPQALLAGIVNGAAGGQIFDQYMTTMKASYQARGFNAARVECVIGKLRATLKPEDLTNIALTTGNNLTNATQVGTKIAEAQKAAEAACP